MKKARHALTHHLELRAKNVIDEGTFLGRWIANADQRWSFVSELVIGYVHVNRALYPSVTRSKVLEAFYSLVVCDEHHWVERVFQVLHH